MELAGNAKTLIELAIAITVLLGIAWKIIRLIDKRLEQLDQSDGHGEAIGRLEVGLTEAIVTQNDMVDRLDEIKNAIRPTNGDQRSISDRLDTVKHDVASLNDRIASHTETDQHNFVALAEWSRQFKDFEPIKLKLYDEDED